MKIFIFINLFINIKILEIWTLSIYTEVFIFRQAIYMTENIRLTPLMN